jgi:hypothetical protein
VCVGVADETPGVGVALLLAAYTGAAEGVDLEADGLIEV